jgi:hypothetical protein
MQRFGITKGELERWRQAMLRDSAQLAEQANSIPHLNSLDFLMESLALGHTVMEHRWGRLRNHHKTQRDACSVAHALPKPTAHQPPTAATAKQMTKPLPPRQVRPRRDAGSSGHHHVG